jgi:hypothetical protein
MNKYYAPYHPQADDEGCYTFKDEEELESFIAQLPDCAGCTYDRNEGTHSYDTKQHGLQSAKWVNRVTTLDERIARMRKSVKERAKEHEPARATLFDY